MIAEPIPSLLSVAEYLALEASSSEKHEYVDGRLYAMASGTTAHDRIANNVRALVNLHLGEGPRLLHGPDVRLRVSPTVYYYPDACVTCDESIEAEALELTRARLVIEVLSPSTEAGDRGEKFIRYQGLTSFEEYVLVDSRSRAVERFRRTGDNTWLYRRYSGEETAPFESVDLMVPVAALYVASGL